MKSGIMKRIVLLRKLAYLGYNLLYVFIMLLYVLRTKEYILGVFYTWGVQKKDKICLNYYYSFLLTFLSNEMFVRKMKCESYWEVEWDMLHQFHSTVPTRQRRKLFWEKSSRNLQLMRREQRTEKKPQKCNFWLKYDTRTIKSKETHWI